MRFDGRKLVNDRFAPEAAAAASKTAGRRDRSCDGTVANRSDSQTGPCDDEIGNQKAAPYS